MAHNLSLGFQHLMLSIQPNKKKWPEEKSRARALFDQHLNYTFLHLG